MKRRPRLIVVEDEPAIAEHIARLGRDRGFEVHRLARAGGFAELVRDRPPDAVVIDLGLPDDAGVWLLRLLARERSQARVIVISGLDARLREAAARLARAYGLDLATALGKPLDDALLGAALDSVPGALRRPPPPP